MNEYKYFVIILYVIGTFDIRIDGQTAVSTHVHRLKHKYGKLDIKTGERMYPATRTDGDVFEMLFGVLLPDEPTEFGCTYHEALPAIELAIKKLQEPDGLFERYNIRVNYHDTKETSVHGTLTIFDLYTKQAGQFFIF